MIVDQTKRGDTRLRFLAAGLFFGLFILLAGLWYVQVVSSKKYKDSLKQQAFRTLRVPGARGRILDRHGQVLADNQPRYNINLYLEDIRHLFLYEYTNSLKKEFFTKHGRNPKSTKEKLELSAEARYRAVSNIVWQVSSALSAAPVVGGVSRGTGDKDIRTYDEDIRT